MLGSSFDGILSLTFILVPGNVRNISSETWNLTEGIQSKSIQLGDHFSADLDQLAELVQSLG